MSATPKDTQSAEAKVFMHGRSQAVRLPKAFRFDTDRVRVSRTPGGGLLLEPVRADVDAYLRRLDALADPDFMSEGRNQPEMPPQKAFFD